MNKKSFIYIMHSETEGRSLYVGKAVDPARRLKEHRRTGHTMKTRLGRWLRRWRLRRLRLVVVEEVPAGEDWREAERFWIASLRAMGARLLNSTDGGDGFDPDPETRERWLKNLRAAMARPETRERCSGRMRQEYADPARREAHSQRMRRAYRDPEKRERMVQATRVGRELRRARDGG